MNSCGGLEPDWSIAPCCQGDGSCVLRPPPGSSVLEMISAFEAASGKKVEHKLVDRRPGDSVAVWAATETAEKELGWKSK